MQGSTDAHSESCKMSKMKRFAKRIIGFYLLTIFVKHSILDVWQGSEQGSVAILILSN